MARKCEECTEWEYFEGYGYGCFYRQTMTPTTKNNFEVDCISREAVERIINKWLSHTDYELKDHIYSMTKKIHNLPSVTPKEPRWVHVTERLPEENERILLNVRMPHYQVVRSGMYHDELFSLDNGDCWRVGDIEAVAWMPAPKEYEGGQGE